jgi:hypothetical protein
VCLDEFDPESNILALPVCRHEFHVECITPWLTERQAKCPLCKYDVLDYVLQQLGDIKIDDPDAAAAAGPDRAAPRAAGNAANRSIWNGLWRRGQWTLLASDLNDPNGDDSGDGDTREADANRGLAHAVEMTTRRQGEGPGDLRRLHE